MKGPTLQKTAALSAALHITFFLLTALILKQSQTMMVPSPYTVSLVGSAGSSKGAAVEEKGTEDAQPDTKATETVKQPDKASVDTKADKKRLDEQIEALKAKKKIERIIKARSIISVGSGPGKSPSKSSAQGAGTGSAGTMFDSYYSKITEQIRQEWAWPAAGDRNLDAVIAVKIAKDGSITVQGIEKGSGNALFDRSALRALAKASPVQPPPYEMEIGMRFYP